jgi:hypothetical protein
MAKPASLLGWSKLDRSRIRQYTRKPLPRKSDVTLCVAAICDDGKSLVGASDRMITAGTQYLSPVPKVVPLTPSIVAMLAGDDVDFIHGILLELRTDIATKAEKARGEYGVKEAAYDLQECFNRARNRLMSQDLLARYEMTPATFPKPNWEKHPALVQEIAQKMEDYRTSDLQILVVGVDRLGAHIYEFENRLTGGGNVHPYDGAGFRAIGSGDSLAHSQLELASYGPSRSEAEALFLVYLAKKRAEVAGGVSKPTDVFLFASGEEELRHYAPLDEESKTRLDKIYEALKASEEKAYSAAMNKTVTWRSLLKMPMAGLGEVKWEGFAPVVIGGKGYLKGSLDRVAPDEPNE